jgi:hypothetical protein
MYTIPEPLLELYDASDAPIAKSSMPSPLISPNLPRRLEGVAPRCAFAAFPVMVNPRLPAENEESDRSE